jgi:hypothetical protein
MYPYPILVGYADTDTRIHHFSGISFDNVRIRVSDTYCIGYPYLYSRNTGIEILNIQYMVLFEVPAGCRTDNYGTSHI